VKRGEILYPHAFSIAAVIAYNGNNASIGEVIEFVGEDGPGAASYHQILRHLRKKGYVSRSFDDSMKRGSRVRWYVTEEGKDIIQASLECYKFVIGLCVEPGKGDTGVA